MGEYYRFYANKDSMLLWSPYVSFRFVPQKITDTGFHTPKLMMSVGRSIRTDINKNAVRALPKETQNNIRNRYTLETWLKPEMTFKDRVTNTIIRSYFKLDKKVKKVLGISAHMDKGTFEIYQFIKFQKPEEMLPMVWGYGRGIGILARMNNMKEENIKHLMIELELNLRMAIKQGYSNPAIES